MSLDTLGTSLRNLGNLFRPSLLNECLALVNACATMADCDRVSNDFRVNGSVYSALSPEDKAVVKLAGQTRRMIITMNSIPGPVAPVTTASVAGDFASIATESTRNAAAIAASSPRRTYRPRQPPTAAQVASAAQNARIVGIKLAGYDGRVVEPTSGIGSTIMIAHEVDGEDRTIDPITGKARQNLIPWSEIETVRIALGLPDGAFGRAPTVKGLLGAATKILGHSGYAVRHSGDGGGKYASTWKIGLADCDLDSESLGTREVLITLSHGGVVECSDESHEAARLVVEGFRRRVSGTLLASDQLRARVLNCLRNHYSVRATWIGLYVPPFQSDRAKVFVDTIRPILGRKIAHCAYAAGDGFANALSGALSDSIEKSIRKLEESIAEKGLDVTPALLSSCESIRSECDGLVSYLGTETIAAFKARLVACDAAIMVGLNDTTQRAMNLEMT